MVCFKALKFFKVKCFSKYSSSESIFSGAQINWFNDELKLHSGLELIPKNDPEKYHHNLYSPWTQTRRIKIVCTTKIRSVHKMFCLNINHWNFLK